MEIYARFNLLTAQGRSQAYAHSEQGAKLVALLEDTEQAHLEEIARMLDCPVHYIIGNAQVVQDELQDVKHDERVKRFKETLSLKQRAHFNRIHRMRLKQEEEMFNMLAGMQEILQEIKTKLGML